MADTDCNADTQANDLFTSLTADAPTPPTIDLTGDEFTFEKDTTSDLYANPNAVTLAELTEVDLEGDGVFDKLMAAVDKHIQREFKGNRITGDQYAAVYTEVMGGVLSQSTSFLLQKDQAKWAALTAQYQARAAAIGETTALVQLEMTKAETQKMIFDMQNSAAQYALTKMQVANADAEYCLTRAQTAKENFALNHLMPADLAISQYQRMQVLPSQVAISKVQSDRLLPAEAALKEFTNREIQPIERDLQNFALTQTKVTEQAISEYQLNSLLPVTLGQEQHKLNFQMPAQTDLIKEQKESQRAQTLDTRSDALTPVSGLLGKQKDGIAIDNTSKQYQLDNTLPIQLDLVKEQREAERAKTIDTRTDGTIIIGSIGKQKDLYTQQIDSFVKDAQHKTAKMYLDGWVTQKTLNENLAAPNELTNSEVQLVLAGVRSENGL